jgi:hypothetical protein
MGSKAGKLFVYMGFVFIGFGDCRFQIIRNYTGRNAPQIMQAILNATYKIGYLLRKRGFKVYWLAPRVATKTSTGFISPVSRSMLWSFFPA